MCDQQLDDIK
jgi:hypothetical protein